MKRSSKAIATVPSEEALQRQVAVRAMAQANADGPETPVGFKPVICPRQDLLIIEELEADEEVELAGFEEALGTGACGYVAMAHAIRGIKAKKLYRKFTSSLEEYYRRRWDFGRSYAARIMAAAGVVELLKDAERLPPTEGHARPLTRLPAKLVPEAWARVLESCNGGELSVRMVESTVASMLLEVGPPKAPRKSKKSRCFERIERLRIEIDLYVDHGHKEHVMKVLDDLAKLIGLPTDGSREDQTTPG